MRRQIQGKEDPESFLAMVNDHFDTIERSLSEAA